MQTKRNPQANDLTAGLDKILRRSGDEQNLHRPSSRHELLLHLQGLFYLALLISATKSRSPGTEGISVLLGLCLARQTNRSQSYQSVAGTRVKESLDPGFRLGCKVIPVLIVKMLTDLSETKSLSEQSTQYISGSWLKVTGINWVTRQTLGKAEKVVVYKTRHIRSSFSNF